MDRQDIPDSAESRPALPYPVSPSPAVRLDLNEDDRLMAALAHASMWLNLVTGFLGLAVAAGIWLVYRDRSRWVANQALQSALLQLVMILAVGVAGASFGLGVAFFWTIVGLLFFPVACLAGLFAAATFLYSLYGALQVYAGRDFRYPILGVVMDAP